MTADRRRSARVPCDLLVTWRRGGRHLRLRAVDVSARGMMLVTDEPVTVPFVMDLVIALPTAPIEVLGVARFVGDTRHGRCVGVSLLSMSDAESAGWWTFYRAALAAAARPQVRFGTAA
jgi:hypothetical protein